MGRVRQVTFIIDGIKDTESGPKTEKTIVTTGAANELSIDFTVNKTIQGSPNTAAIRITNLSPALRKKLHQPRISVRLYVGYVDGEQSLLFKGGVQSAYSERANDSDIITLINAMDGLGAQISAFYNEAHAGGVGLNGIIKEMAQTFEGVSIGEINVSGVIGQKGRVFTGSVVDSLDKLARNYRFSWSIQDGVFQAIEDKQSTAKIYKLASESNLIGITPSLQGAFNVATGARILSVLDPRIKPADAVRVESSIEPEMNKVYKVTSVQSEGASHSDKWSTAIESMYMM